MKLSPRLFNGIWTRRKWISNQIQLTFLIWDALRNLHHLKNLKNNHGGVLLLVKLQATSCSFTKSNTPPWVFFTFCKVHKGTKSRKAFHIYVCNVSKFLCKNSSRVICPFYVLVNILLGKIISWEKKLKFVKYTLTND